MQLKEHQHEISDAESVADEMIQYFLNVTDTVIADHPMNVYTL